MSEKNILEEIAEKTRERIRKEKLQFPLDQLKALAEKHHSSRPFWKR